MGELLWIRSWDTFASTFCEASSSRELSVEALELTGFRDFDSIRLYKLTRPGSHTYTP